MARKAITSKGAVSTGTYSHGIDTGEYVFVSGQTPIDPATQKLVQSSIEEETRQCVDNLRAVLAEAGLTLDDVQKVNVYLTDMENFTAMNEVYKQQFSQPYPARTTIGVVSLPLGAGGNGTDRQAPVNAGTSPKRDVFNFGTAPQYSGQTWRSCPI